MTSSAIPARQQGERLTISAFARAVGLTPSALRFYDDAGLLAPATVDERNGYRYYDDSQRRRAVLVRRMRELDVPLVTMRAVLDGPPEQAERLLAEHVSRLSERAERARAAVDGILRALRAPSAEPAAVTTFTVGGAELAGAIRQVGPFAGTAAEDAALDCLLLDVVEGELTVVGTDRYRLGARTLPITELDGPERRLPVAVTELTGLAGWLRRRHRVRLTAGGPELIIAPVAPMIIDDGVTAAAGPVDHDQHAELSDERRRLTVLADRFPDYRQLLDASAPPGRHRMIIDRIRLLELIAADQTTTVVIDPGDDEVIIGRLNDPEVRRLPAVCSGPAHRIAFSPQLLASALQSSVGPDVLIESAPRHPAVVRSADEGSFSTLVMPRRLDGADDPQRVGDA